MTQRPELIMKYEKISERQHNTVAVPLSHSPFQSLELSPNSLTDSVYEKRQKHFLVELKSAKNLSSAFSEGKQKMESDVNSNQKHIP